jgi:hypothetical protein
MTSDAAWKPDDGAGFELDCGAVVLDVSPLNAGVHWQVHWFGSDSWEHGNEPTVESAKAAAMECARRVLREALAKLGGDGE